MTGAETRPKATDESLKKLETQFQQYMTTNDERLENPGKKLELLVEKVLPTQDGLGSAPMENLSNVGPITRPWVRENRDNPGGRNNGHSSQSRVKMPYFDGVDPCAWLRKCERFEEQTGSVDEYLEKFEELKAWVLIRNPTIPEEFFLEFFIEGLKEEIRHTVKMLDPYSFNKVIEKARHNENLLEADTKAGKSQWNKRSTTGYYSQPTKSSNGGSSYSNNKLFESRKAQGLCYKCGEKYHSGHQCKPRQLNAISAATEEDLEGALHQEKAVVIPEEEIVDGAISLNVLSGTEVSNTIKLREAENSFQALKQAMSSAPVLALADFNTPLIIKTDACSKGMGAVL
ncbi:hypothetical protein A4A49_63876, partial [Nicotiana attenuata]